jgi:hypothetical protein
VCSMTRAPILIRRSRSVANLQLASGLVRGIAARTPCISQNAAVWRRSQDRSCDALVALIVPAFEADDAKSAVAEVLIGNYGVVWWGYQTSL